MVAKSRSAQIPNFMKLAILLFTKPDNFRCFKEIRFGFSIFGHDWVC